MASTGWGSLKGQVTYDGEPPMLGNLEIPADKNKDVCEKGDIRIQTWKVGPDKGVANVVVWLRLPRASTSRSPTI